MLRKKKGQFMTLCNIITACLDHNHIATESSSLGVINKVYSIKCLLGNTQ